MAKELIGDFEFGYKFDYIAPGVLIGSRSELFNPPDPDLKL